MGQTLTFWGTRGSIPTPGPQTARYGGNTPCLSIADDQHRVVILDAGSGIRPLGHELMRRRNGSGLEADILLTHTHWDHIQGLPFFTPLGAAGNRVTIYGAAQGGVPLGEILDRQMAPMVFPVPLQALGAELRIAEIVEGPLALERLAVEALRLRHPGTTLGYKLTPAGGGRVVAYLTDNELTGGSYAVPDDWRDRAVSFLEGVDTLIHDAMYSEATITARAGWGHSTPREAVELAAEAGCRRLILFHHEPEHTDEAMDALLRDAREHARRIAPTLEVDAAVEGMTIAL